MPPYFSQQTSGNNSSSEEWQQVFVCEDGLK